jgi:hypothetical protein
MKIQEKISIVVTSISKPNKALLALSEGCIKHVYQFIVIGDVTSPTEFSIQGCDYYSIDRQIQTGLEFAKQCPQKHYARKNIGYLLAIQQGTNIIIDTDDDNIPYSTFWNPRKRIYQVPVVKEKGWLNIYSYFSSTNIWPRGFPLNKIHSNTPSFESLPVQTVDCPIQQGLSNENPDVDAIYRLTLPLPQNFKTDRQIALASEVWCPFNSQNTTWWEKTFPLLYLPAYCSFRMTDIWRSFVAQRIAWENNWEILFHEPTVWQERNEHNLMDDFADEIPGYLQNEKICNELKKLSIKSGAENLDYNLSISYEKLVELGMIDKKELKLLETWLSDLEKVKANKEI